MSSPLDMSMYLNGVKIPNYSSMVRAYEINQTVIQSLGGTLYTDFLNIRRTWKITWDDLYRSDYDLIYSYFLYQYQNNMYPRLRVPSLNIDVPVMLFISDQKVAHNAVLVKDFYLYAMEQYAFS